MVVLLFIWAFRRVGDDASIPNVHRQVCRPALLACPAACMRFCVHFFKFSPK